MPKLILIDGYSYLYRAFHALPQLSNAQGEPTGAMFGVVNMLRAILDARPEYAAFVADAPGPTFREEIYPEYKANRPPMPQELRAQIEPLLGIVQAQGFPMLRVPGVEADDVIGTLAKQAAESGLDVEVSTSDKDFAQLVEPRITLNNSMSRTTTDVEGVREKFGVTPGQIIDFLALTGDSIDNVPGVNKCGPKTAAKWLGEYGDLDAVIAHAGKIGGKIGENLRDALEQLPLSRVLVTIKTDVELDVTVDELGLREPDIETLRELYTRYEFKAALKALDQEPGHGTGDPGPKQEPGPGTGDPGPKQEPGPGTGDPGPDTAATATASSSRPGIGRDPDPGMENTPGEYELVTTQAQLDTWLERLQDASLVAFDTETTSLDPMRAEIVGVSFAVEAGEAAYVPLAHAYPGVPKQLDRDQTLAALKPLLENPDKPKLAQHGKYDINVLSHYGIEVQGLAHDSMLESYVWNATAIRHDMDSLAQRYLGYETVKYSEVAGKGARQIGFAEVELDTASHYAAEDADITLRLHRALWPKLEAEPALARVYREIEMPLVPVLARMEQRGVLVDVDELRDQSRDLAARMQSTREAAHEIVGHEFNLDSPKQLGEILFERFELPVKVRTPSRKPSTNEEALAGLADEHPLPALVLQYRGLAKLRSTYTEKLVDIVNPRTGRVHTSYHQAVAGTGRLSSSDPNLQNIPVRTEEGRRIRKAFIAPEGWRVLAADYSQIELRIMAHLSGDEGLLEAFRQGEDIHRATAAEVFDRALDEVEPNQRRAAKAINFGLMYGMSAFGLARQLGIDRGEAAEYIERYFARYPGVRQYMDSTRAQASERGYVETLFGRRLYLNEINARNQARRAGAERAAINAPMQGTAADIIKRAMIEVDAWLRDRDDAQMLMQVHDELVFEVREDAVEPIQAGVSQRMVTAADLEVPLVVDIGVGANWEEAH